jgi:hypothetical protein
MAEALIDVADVRTFETKGGNTRYVVADGRGDEYTTFREQIGQAAVALKGGRARITFHEQQRGPYTNVYLDAIEPTPDEAPGGPDEDTEPEEVGWRTAVEAAPYLTGTSEPKREMEPDDLFEKLKPFKDKVAEDIREDGEEGEDSK